MSNLNCYLHPNIVGTASCDKCHQLICEADHRNFQSNVYCPNCYKTSKKPLNVYLLILIIFAILVYGSLFLGMVLYNPHIKIAHTLSMILFLGSKIYL